MVWNCRGAGSACFLRNLLLLVRIHHCSILVLLETRVNSSYINAIISKSSFTNFFVSEAMGFSRGIWVLWNSGDVKVELISLDEKVINVFLSTKNKPP